MAKNITLLGASYSGVPAVTLPVTGGGTATFTDVTDTTATESDVATGKLFYTAAGVLTTGTASGGTGTSEWTHLKTQEFTISTTSTSAASAGTIACGSVASDDAVIIYVRVRDKSGKRAGYFAGSDAFFMNYNRANNSTSAFSVPAVMCYRYTTSSAWAGTAGQYGVYGYSIASNGTITIRRRYNSSYSLTIDSTYVVDVFTLSYPDGYPSVFDITAQ